MDTDEDFLAAVEADNATTPAEEPKEPEAPVEPEAPKPEPEAPAPAEPAPAEPATVAEVTKQPDPGYVPIGVVLDTRDKLKAAEAELERFRSQQQPEPAEIPDPDLDPLGFAQYQQAVNQQALLNTKLDISEEMARERHGADLVDRAKAWALQRFAENPAYQAEVLRQRHPYSHVVTEFQRNEALGKLGDPTEIDRYLAWKEAQGQVEQQQGGQPPPPTPTPSIPPRSLASAPSAGAIREGVVQSDEEIFDEVIGKR